MIDSIRKLSSRRFQACMLLSTLVLATSPAAAQTQVMHYRADQTSPTVAFEHGLDSPVFANYQHFFPETIVSQHVVNPKRHRATFVSTTDHEDVAINWRATLMDTASSWVYVIRPDQTFYNVSISLGAEIERVQSLVDMPAERAAYIEGRLNLILQSFANQREWVKYGGIPARNIKEARTNYRMEGGFLKYDSIVNPDYDATPSTPNAGPYPSHDFLRDDRADLVGIPSSDPKWVWSASFLPTNCRALGEGPACGTPKVLHAATPADFMLRFSHDQMTALPEGQDRWWVDVDHDGQTDYCYASNNTKMTCAYNHGLTFDTVQASTSGRDLGWGDGRAWVPVSNSNTPDYCRIVFTYTEIRCSPVLAPGVAGGLFRSTDIVSGYIDAGYASDRMWGDVGSMAGPADGRADFCRVMWGDGTYLLGCQVANARSEGNFSNAWKGDFTTPLADHMVGSDLYKSMVDINGDLKADYCVTKPDLTFIECLLANTDGTGFAGRVSVHPHARSYIASTGQWIDYDKDGRQDFCAIYNEDIGKEMICYTWDPDNRTTFRVLSRNFPADIGYSGYAQLSDVGGRGFANFCTIVGTDKKIQCSLPTSDLSHAYFSTSDVIDAGWPDVWNRRVVYLQRGRGGFGAYCRSMDMGFNGQIVCKKIW